MSMEMPLGELALPQLYVGSHAAGSGKACIMNAIAYLNGEKNITDMPDCVWPPLARAAQIVNDSICRHGDQHPGEERKLCNNCAHLVWKLGAKLIGTGDPVREMSRSVRRQLVHQVIMAVLQQVGNPYTLPYELANDWHKLNNGHDPGGPAPLDDEALMWSEPYRVNMFIVRSAIRLFRNFDDDALVTRFLTDYLKLPGGGGFPTKLDQVADAVNRFIAPHAERRHWSEDDVSTLKERAPELFAGAAA